MLTKSKTASDCITAFETLIEAYAKVGKSLARFESLRQTFDHDIGFQEIVAVFYRDIVKFHECAYKFVTVNGELSPLKPWPQLFIMPETSG